MGKDEPKPPCPKGCSSDFVYETHLFGVYACGICGQLFEEDEDGNNGMGVAVEVIGVRGGGTSVAPVPGTMEEIGRGGIE